MLHPPQVTPFFGTNFGQQCPLYINQSRGRAPLKFRLSILVNYEPTLFLAKVHESSLQNICKNSYATKINKKQN